MADSFTITVLDFVVTVTKNQMVRLSEPHDLVIGGFSDMDKNAMLGFITSEVGPITNHRHFNRGGKPYLSISAEGFRAAKDLYNREKPLIFARANSRSEFILSVDWAIDFNTNGPTAVSKAIISPTKGKPRGAGTAQISTLQNQLRLLQEIRAQDTERIVTRIDTSLAKQWTKTVQLITQSQEHAQRVLCSTVTQVTDRINLLHRQTQRENSRQMALQIKSFQLLFFQASSDPALRSQCNEIKKELDQIQMEIYALEDQTNQILDKTIVIPADPHAMQQLPASPTATATITEDDDSFLDELTFVTKTPTPAQIEDTDTVVIDDDYPKGKVTKIAKRVEITPDHTLLNKWQAMETGGKSRASILEEQWAAEVDPLLEMYVYRTDGYWLFTDVTTDEQKMEFLTILQSFATYFRGAQKVYISPVTVIHRQQIRVATDIISELAGPILAEIKSKKKKENKQWKAKLMADKEKEALEKQNADNEGQPPAKKPKKPATSTPSNSNSKPRDKQLRNARKKAKKAAAKQARKAG